MTDFVKAGNATFCELLENDSDTSAVYIVYMQHNYKRMGLSLTSRETVILISRHIAQHIAINYVCIYTCTKKRLFHNTIAIAVLMIYCDAFIYLYNSKHVKKKHSCNIAFLKIYHSGWRSLVLRGVRVVGPELSQDLFISGRK